MANWVKKMGLSWEGTKSYLTKEGFAYSWYYKPRSKNSPPRSTLTIATTLPVPFEIKREGFFLRFAKLLGFAQEFQTQDRDFDDKFYIVCDDKRFCTSLQMNGQMRLAVRSAFSQPIRSVIARKEAIVVEMKNATTEPDLDSAETLVKALHDIAKTAAHLPSGGAMIRSGISMGSYANTACGLFYLMLVGGGMGLAFQPYKLFDYLTMAKLALPYAAIVAAVGLVMIRILFQSSSRGYLVFYTYLFAGLPGIAICTYLTLYAINIEMDKSPAAFRTVIISAKNSTHGKHGTHYYIYTPNPYSAGDEVKFSTSYDTYNRVSIGTPVTLTIRSGALKQPWIEHHEIMGIR